MDDLFAGNRFMCPTSETFGKPLGTLHHDVTHASETWTQFVCHELQRFISMHTCFTSFNNSSTARQTSVANSFFKMVKGCFHFFCGPATPCGEPLGSADTERGPDKRLSHQLGGMLCIGGANQTS